LLLLSLLLLLSECGPWMLQPKRSSMLWWLLSWFRYLLLLLFFRVEIEFAWTAVKLGLLLMKMTITKKTAQPWNLLRM
jgi:hypothetical protein